MKLPLALSITGLAAVFFAMGALAQNVVETVPTPPGNKSTTIFRQVLPNGQIVYSDKAVKNGKVDHTITVEPAIKGNLWTTEPSTRPNIPEQVERTKIIRAPTASPAEKKKILERAESNVIRAEMMLEDAKRNQENGAEPLPGERSGNVNGTTRLNEVYESRQKLLAKEVARADAGLRRALAEQDALR